jgi:hypothetical protein
MSTAATLPGQEQAMLTLSLSLAPARVPFLHDTRLTSGFAGTAHQAASIGATASGVAILLAVAVVAFFQLALLVAGMLAQAVIALFRLLAVPLLILLIVYLLLLAAHAKAHAPSGLARSAPNQISSPCSDVRELTGSSSGSGLPNGTLLGSRAQPATYAQRRSPVRQARGQGMRVRGQEQDRLVLRNGALRILASGRSVPRPASRTPQPTTVTSLEMCHRKRSEIAASRWRR